MLSNVWSQNMYIVCLVGGQMDSNVDDSGYPVCIGMAQNCDAGAESSCTDSEVEKFYLGHFYSMIGHVCCHYVDLSQYISHISYGHNY